MAKFNANIPNDLLKEFDELAIATPQMIGDMTKAGAETVRNIVKSNLSKSFKSTDRLQEHLYVSKTYHTPSDDGTNNKVYFYGYLDKNKKHPVPLVAMAREYGTSKGEAKKPFFRKSFNQKAIEDAMKKIQDDYMPKEWDYE